MPITVAHLQALVTADTGDAERKLTTFSGKLEGLSKKASKLGTSMTMFVTLPLVAAGGAIVNMASDYEESLNKVKVVFGEASASMEEFAKSAATNLGMSEQAALEAGGTFGNLLTAMGMTQVEAVGMSKEILQLAADLGSFNNIDPTLVLEKLRSGLVGETEPLRVLGINLTQAKVEMKALEMGIWDGKGAIDDVALATARWALILEQTGTAQGDFERTSEGLANKTRTVKAQFEDIGRELGENLLPMALELANAISGILTAFNNLSPGVQKAIVYFGIALAAIGPLLKIFGALGTIVAWVAGLFGTGGALSGAFAGLSTFVSLTLAPVLASLGGILAAITLPVWLLIAAIGALVAVIIIFGKDAANSFSMLAQIVAAVFKKMLDDIINWGAQILEYIKELALNLAKNAKSWFGTVGKAIVDGIWQGIKNGWNWLTSQVASLAQNLLKVAKAALGIKSPSQLFAIEVGKPIAEGIGLGFREAMKSMGSGMAAAMKPESLQPVGAGAGGGTLGMGGMRSRQPVNLTVNIGGRELRKVVVDAINQELAI